MIDSREKGLERREDGGGEERMDTPEDRKGEEGNNG